MPDITPVELEGIQSQIAEYCPGLALAFAEQLNHETILESPVVREVPIQELLARDDSVLCSQFHFNNLLTSESLFVVSEETAALMLDLVKGNSGANPPAQVADDQIPALETAMTGVARGLGTVIGNQVGETLDLETCNSHLGTLSLPPVFAMSGSAVEITFSFTINDLSDTQLTLFMTPDMARVLAPAESQQSSGDQLLDQDELAAMLGDLTSGLDAPAPGLQPTAAAPTGATPAPDLGMPRGLDMILDIPLDVTVELGRVRMLIKDVLELSSGSIVELDRVAGEPVDLLVNGRLIAKGEVVVIEDNFGIRVTEIISPVERVAGLGRGR